MSYAMHIKEKDENLRFTAGAKSSLGKEMAAEIHYESICYLATARTSEAFPPFLVSSTPVWDVSC